MPYNQQLYIKTMIGVVLVLQILIWIVAYGEQARWTNVPPVPNQATAKFGTLGDAQLYYRLTGLMLQNLGDYGGKTTALQDYDYDTLGQWFMLTKDLDQISNYVPYLAAYYFSASQDPLKLYPLVDYLSEIGLGKLPGKWRWLAQAAFIARFNIQDLDLSLKISNKLANLQNVNLPIWARQMPALVLHAKGDKEAAYAIAAETLKSEGENMDATEVNFIMSLICTRILNSQEAKEDPICKLIR